MRLCLLALLFGLNHTCFAQVDRDIQLIEKRMGSAPLIVLTYAEKELGIDAKVRGELSKSKLMRPDFRAEDGDEPAWKQRRQLLYRVLSLEAQELHAQYTFQYLVANGQPNGALRYAGVRLSDEDVKAVNFEMLKLRKKTVKQIERERVLLSKQIGKDPGHRLNGREFLALQQFRGWQNFSPLVKKYLEEYEFSRLTKDRYIPNGSGGEKPLMDAAIFKRFKFK